MSRDSLWRKTSKNPELRPEFLMRWRFGIAGNLAGTIGLAIVVAQFCPCLEAQTVTIDISPTGRGGAGSWTRLEPRPALKFRAA